MVTHSQYQQYQQTTHTAVNHSATANQVHQQVQHSWTTRGICLLENYDPNDAPLPSSDQSFSISRFLYRGHVDDDTYTHAGS